MGFTATPGGVSFEAAASVCTLPVSKTAVQYQNQGITCSRGSSSQSTPRTIRVQDDMFFVFQMHSFNQIIKMYETHDTCSGEDQYKRPQATQDPRFGPPTPRPPRLPSLKTYSDETVDPRNKKISLNYKRNHWPREIGPPCMHFLLYSCSVTCPQSRPRH